MCNSVSEGREDATARRRARIRMGMPEGIWAASSSPYARKPVGQSSLLRPQDLFY